MEISCWRAGSATNLVAANARIDWLVAIFCLQKWHFFKLQTDLNAKSQRHSSSDVPWHREELRELAFSMPSETD